MVLCTVIVCPEKIDIHSFKISIYDINRISVDYTCQSTRHLLRINNTCILKLMHKYIQTGRKM
jgi:hypothetical protein